MNFLVGLAALSVLIFSLNIASEQMSRWREGEERSRHRRFPYARANAIADQFEIHNRQQESSERRRTIRDSLTIAGIFATAGFALVQAWIFHGQLGEMHQASIDTANLVKTARDTEERQLRAYLGITDYPVLKCHSCNVGSYNPGPQHVEDNVINFNILNGGQTPAYDVHVEYGLFPTVYEGRLPPGFTYPIFKGTEHFAGISPSIVNGAGMINSREASPATIGLPQNTIDLFVQAQHHRITVFYYGNIRYTDVFDKNVLLHTVLNTCQIYRLMSNSYPARNTTPHQKMDNGTHVPYEAGTAGSYYSSCSSVAGPKTGYVNMLTLPPAQGGLGAGHDR